MDNLRFILILAIGLVFMILMQKWQEDYGVTETVTVKETTNKQELGSQLVDMPDNPTLEVSTPKSTIESDTKFVAVNTIDVKTDVFDLEIDLSGGSIITADLVQYPVEMNGQEGSEPLRLFDHTSQLYYVLKGGLLSNELAPNHQAIYTADRSRYELASDANELLVDLYWYLDGIDIVKRYRFKRGAYDFDIEYMVNNQTSQNWEARAYGQIQRSPEESSGNRFIYTYTGGVISSPEKRYEKISFDDMEDNDFEQYIVDGWAAMLQHYFLSALIPSNQEQNYYFYTKALKSEERYILGMMTPVLNVPAGESDKISHRVYIGPKVQNELAQVAPELDLTVDYGIFWFIAKPLYLCLDLFHSLIGNWGWSILLVTFFLKLIFYPLSGAGYRSMANMRRVQPRMVALRDRYKDDKARLNQAMMEMYKTEKINPLGGCLPILIQIPVFISLYWVLLESVELRQAPFVLWIQDLSVPDPIFVLPLIMGATMFLQQKLNPAPMDPMQQKVMSFLPIVFTVFFAFFPSGLVLYWVANNILSILQQARINHNLEKAGLK